MLGQGSFLAADAHREEPRIEHGEGHRREPRTGDQRNGDPLDDHGQIVGMPEVAIGSARDRRLAGDDDHANVPAGSERRDGPVAETLRQELEPEHRNAERRNEGPTCEHRLGAARDEERTVQHRHGDEVPSAHLDRPAREGMRGVSPADLQLEQTLQAEQDEERKVELHHCRRTSSAQKPGPMAIMRPYAPGGGRRVSIVSRSTMRTEALERLPTAFRLSQVAARAASSRSRARWTASMTRGPPGWQT